MSTKAVIFDMDGVIIDSEHLKFQAYEKVFRDEFGVEIDSVDWISGAYEPVEMESYLNKHDLQGNIENLVQKKREAYDLLLNQISLIPGVENFIKGLKARSFLLGLATSSNRKSADVILDKFDMRKMFDSVLTQEDILRKKPDPEMYLKSAELLGVEPANCAVVEDSPTGVEAGKRAGMKVIAVTTGVKEDVLKDADLIIDEFSELTVDKVNSLLNS